METPSEKEPEAQRKQSILDYLEGLEKKTPIVIGCVVTCSAEDHLGSMFMVDRKRENGLYEVSGYGITGLAFREEQLWHYQDFHVAYFESIKKHPFTPEEIAKSKGIF